MKSFLIVSVLLSALIFQACVKDIPSDTPDPEKPEVIPSNAFKVISFNVRYDNDKDTAIGHGWFKRRPGICEMVRKEHPLLMGVQECLISQREGILAGCQDYDVIGVGRDDGASKGESMSIFYLRDSVIVSEWGTFWLGETPDVPGSKGWGASLPRTVTWAVIHHRRLDRDVFYVNTHFHGGEQIQLNSVAQILDFISERSHGLPVLLTGDLNAGLGSATLKALNNKLTNARDVAPVTDTYGTTNNSFTSYTETKIIDHIYFKGLTARSYRTIRDSFDGIDFISDHFPISAVLEF